MKPSQNCINFIKDREELRLHAYLDSAHIPTIGWGSLRMPNGAQVKLGDTITEQEAEQLLAREIGEKTWRIDTLVKNVNLTQGMYDALVSFAYNVGVGGLEMSTLLKKVKTDPYDRTMIPYEQCHPTVQNWMDKQNPKMGGINTIHHEFMKWVLITVNGKKQIALGLQRRRDAEYHLLYRS